MKIERIYRLENFYGLWRFKHYGLRHWVFQKGFKVGIFGGADDFSVVMKIERIYRLENFYGLWRFKHYGLRHWVFQKGFKVGIFGGADAFYYQMADFNKIVVEMFCDFIRVCNLGCSQLLFW